MPMRVVYNLRDEHKAKPEFVAQVQALTLNPGKPAAGLRGMHGLYGSEAWWESIRDGRIKTAVVTGTIIEMFYGGRDSGWGSKDNGFCLALEDGSTKFESVYVNHKSARRLFAVGATVCITYAFDELKSQPGPDGSTNYSQQVLEMLVSMTPSRASREK